MSADGYTRDDRKDVYGGGAERSRHHQYRDTDHHGLLEPHPACCWSHRRRPTRPSARADSRKSSRWPCLRIAVCYQEEVRDPTRIARSPQPRDSEKRLARFRSGTDKCAARHVDKGYRYRTAPDYRDLGHQRGRRRWPLPPQRSCYLQREVPGHSQWRRRDSRGSDSDVCRQNWRNGCRCAGLLQLSAQ